MVRDPRDAVVPMYFEASRQHAVHRRARRVHPPADGGIDAIIQHLSPADLDYINTRIAARLPASYAEYRAADRQLRA